MKMPQLAASITSPSRRRFLRVGCLSTAALGLSLCGVGAMLPGPQPVDLSSATFGERRSDHRVLIAYASFAGSTEEVAVAIGRTLGARGFSVDVVPIVEQPSVDGYQFVIIGSAVYGSSWRPEAVEFVEAQQAALRSVPVALFSVCLAGLSEDEALLPELLATIYDPVRPWVNVVAEVLFAGKVDARGASLFLPGGLARCFPTLDFRDWDAIRHWAQTVFELELEQPGGHL